MNSLVPIFQFSLSESLALLFYICVLIFTIHTVIVVYHWFTFGTERSVPMLATIIYVGGGTTIIGFMLFLLTTL